MPLSVESRRVGDVTVVTCRGRLIEGAESVPLQQALDGVLAFPNPYIVLDLGGVDFIDSAGLGLLTRYLSRSRAARGHLTLCAVPPKVSEVLRITKLQSVFESYASEVEAIAHAHQPAPSASASSRVSTDILCVEKSVDVQCYVRELLAQEGYSVLTAGNVADGLILLQSVRPKVVVISADLRALNTTRTAERFNTLANTHVVVELPAGFSSDDAGEAGQRLIEQIRAVASVGAKS